MAMAPRDTGACLEAQQRNRQAAFFCPKLFHPQAGDLGHLRPGLWRLGQVVHLAPSAVVFVCHGKLLLIKVLGSGLLRRRYRPRGAPAIFPSRSTASPRKKVWTTRLSSVVF